MKFLSLDLKKQENATLVPMWSNLLPLSTRVVCPWVNELQPLGGKMVVRVKGKLGLLLLVKYTHKTWGSLSQIVKMKDGWCPLLSRSPSMILKLRRLIEVWIWEGKKESVEFKEPAALRRLTRTSGRHLILETIQLPSNSYGHDTDNS